MAQQGWGGQGWGGRSAAAPLAHPGVGKEGGGVVPGGVAGGGVGGAVKGCAGVALGAAEARVAAAEAAQGDHQAEGGRSSQARQQGQHEGGLKHSVVDEGCVCVGGPGVHQHVPVVRLHIGRHCAQACHHSPGVHCPLPAHSLALRQHSLWAHCEQGSVGLDSHQVPLPRKLHAIAAAQGQASRQRQQRQLQGDLASARAQVIQHQAALCHWLAGGGRGPAGSTGSTGSCSSSSSSCSSRSRGHSAGSSAASRGCPAPTLCVPGAGGGVQVPATPAAPHQGLQAGQHADTEDIALHRAGQHLAIRQVAPQAPHAQPATVRLSGLALTDGVGRHLVAHLPQQGHQHALKEVRVTQGLHGGQGGSAEVQM